jgi:DNA invertase Pin-like site-specific DNA recombinase
VLIGYARVSTGDQDLSLQLEALTEAGCARCFSDTASGSVRDRPQLQRVLEELRDGEDTLVVWRLDRLGRSLRHLIELVGELEDRELGFRSLTEGIDTTTSAGRLVFHIFGAIAEFERQLIRERTQAGLQAARARGRLGGRRTVITDSKLRVAHELIAGGQHTMQQVADTIGVGRATLYRHLTPNDLRNDGSSAPRAAHPSGPPGSQTPSAASHGGSPVRKCLVRAGTP